MAINVNDYLINHTNKDWRRLLERWMPPLPVDCTIWLVNKLGELIVVSNETVHWLVVGEGKLIQIANSQDHFAQLLDTENNADQWLRFSLVDACRNANMALTENECYGFKIPPALQGQYVATNLKPTPLDKHYSLLAHLSKQDEIYWTG